MATRKITAAEKKDMALVEKALMGDRKAIAEFDRIHGKGELDRRCDKLLRAIFETPAPVKKAKAKSTDVKKTAVADCIGAIDGSMAALKGLTGNSQAFKELEDEWKALSRTLKKLGQKKDSAKKAVGRAVADVLVKANDKTVKNEAGKARNSPGVKVLEKAVGKKLQPPVAPQVTKEPPLPSSVRISDREMELHLGSFGAKPLAEHDASELIGHPMVFWYRRGVFPDPRQSRVNPTVIEAKVVERKGKAFRSAPFTVHVKIGMAGDAAHCRSWAKGVLARNKGDQE